MQLVRLAPVMDCRGLVSIAGQFLRSSGGISRADKIIAGIPQLAPGPSRGSCGQTACSQLGSTQVKSSQVEPGAGTQSQCQCQMQTQTQGNRQIAAAK